MWFTGFEQFAVDVSHARKAMMYLLAVAFPPDVAVLEVVDAEFPPIKSPVATRSVRATCT